MIWELPDIQTGFRKVRETRDQTAICWSIEKGREFQKKKSTSASVTMLKPLTVWITANYGKFLKRWEYQTTLTCLLRNLYTGQEATVRTGHGTMDWFQIGKGLCQSWILSPCLLNYMLSTSCEMPVWINHRLESRLSGEISISSDMQMMPSLREKVKRN